MSRNRRKTARNYTYNPSYDSIVRTDLSRTITVHLTDPDEPDRYVFLNVSPEDAHLLAHRLLHHVAAFDEARS